MYGIDLRAAIYGPSPAGFRRLLTLVKNLPTGSATWVEVLGQGANWSNETELLALIAELIHHQTRSLARVMGAKGDMEALRIPRPEQPDIAAPPSPDGQPDVQRLASAEDIAAFFGLEKQE